MKEKVLTFIIGFLIGAIIATAGFLIYSKIIGNNANQNRMMQMNENGQIEPPSGDMEQPPEQPSGNNNGSLPTKPEENNNTSN